MLQNKNNCNKKNTTDYKLPLAARRRTAMRLFQLMTQVADFLFVQGDDIGVTVSLTLKVLQGCAVVKLKVMELELVIFH